MPRRTVQHQQQQQPQQQQRWLRHPRRQVWEEEEEEEEREGVAVSKALCVPLLKRASPLHPLQGKGRITRLRIGGLRILE
jgi:hypothetical protein